MMKKLPHILILCLFVFSCAKNVQKKQEISSLPAWYISPTQNDSSSLYGAGEGYTLEEGTKSALADMAARLIVSISSNSSLLREENNNSANEEMRQKISQNIEKIDFANFYVSQSTSFQGKIYVEVGVDRAQFIAAQRQKQEFLEEKISNLENNLSSQNLIRQRNSLLQQVQLLQEEEIVAKILQGLSQNSNVAQVMSKLASAQNKLAKLNDKVEFYFEIDGNQKIAAIIRSALNKEKIAVAKYKTGAKNQIVVAVHSSSKAGEVYGAFVVKLNTDFENKSEGKVIASSQIEVSGSSTINQKEAQDAAYEALKEKIEKDGVLKVMGII